MSYSLRLKYIRRQRKLTQAQLAKMVGATERVVGAWERGETEITLADACLVCDALGCTPNDLCGWYDEHPGDAVDVTRDPDESSIISNYRNSDEDGRATIVSVARMACGHSQEARGSSYELIAEVHLPERGKMANVKLGRKSKAV